MRQRCGCGRGAYDDVEYDSCYECFLDRREDYVSCIYCDRWHSPQFDTCFKCRPRGRDEAARDLKLMVHGRDSYRCQYCGVSQGDEQLDPRKVDADQQAGVASPGMRYASLHIDHIRPCAKGGTADPWNLQTLCAVCNVSKGAIWYPGCRHEGARNQIVHAYLTYLWAYLTREEQDRLLNDAGLDYLAETSAA